MTTKPVSLACYLLREDGEWYELGNVPQWRISFGVFPGGIDGSTVFSPEDVHLLSLRLDDYGYTTSELKGIATNIIQWSQGKSVRFMSELDPEVEPDVPPSPITGSVQQALRVSDLSDTSSA